jgi:hypothetical protein
LRAEIRISGKVPSFNPVPNIGIGFYFLKLYRISLRAIHLYFYVIPSIYSIFQGERGAQNVQEPVWKTKVLTANPIPIA